MATSEFYKQMGAEQRQDELVAQSTKNYILFFGFGHDENGQGYKWRKNYDHCPTASELKADIDGLINSITDRAILSGFVWNGKPVWLSQENQINFKAAYDLAVQTQGATLPVKFKLGEDAEGNPVYHTFTKMEPFTDFYTKAIAHVIRCLNEGWQEKDGVDYETLCNQSWN